jgi:hypothetical protein
VAAVVVRVLAELRRRWVAWVVLAVVVGLASGAVLASLAAARRADSSYDRFLRLTNPFDVAVQGSTQLPIDEVAALPEVVESGIVTFVLLVEPGSEGAPTVDELTPLVGRDGIVFERLNTARVLEGRPPTEPLEITISPHVASSRSLDVGDTITMASFSQEQLEALLVGGTIGAPEGPTLPFAVVGVAVAPTEFLPSGNHSTIHLAPAFLDVYEDQVGVSNGVGVRLRDGDADLPSFKAGVERLLDGEQPGYITQAEDAERVRRSIHLQAVALRAFAGVAALVGLVVLGQGLVRQAAIEGSEDRTLAALGMTRAQVGGLVLVRAGIVGLLAAAVAVVLAVALSPVLLFGLAEQAEPDKGVSVDGTVLALGAAAIVALTLAMSVVAAALRWRQASSQAARGGRASRPSAAARVAAQVGASPRTTAGIRLALESGGSSTSVPVRSSLVGAATSIGAVVMAISFAASLDHLFDTPRLYGWNWDALYGSPYSEDLADQVVPVLRANPEVGGFSTISFSQVDIGDERTQALAFDALQGSVLPTVAAGRAPDRPDEVAVGSVTLDRIDAAIGDVVALRVGDRSLDVRIVGEVVLPSLGQYDVEGLGEGVLATQAGLERIAGADRNLFAVSFAAGTEPEDVAVPLGLDAGIELNSFAVAPEEVANFGNVDSFPAVLAGLLGAIGAATLAHVVAVGVRRRRRELAILRVLGFVRRDLRSVVGWQVSTLTLVALVAGLPLGIAAGRLAWTLFADGLGVLPEPVTPGLVLLLLVPVSFAVAHAVAILPGRLASGAAAVDSLRPE